MWLRLCFCWCKIKTWLLAKVKNFFQFSWRSWSSNWLKRSCIKNCRCEDSSSYTGRWHAYSLGAAGVLLSSLFREVLVLCISTKGFSHNCIKIFCSMKMKGVMCDVLHSHILLRQFKLTVLQSVFLPSVRLVFPSYMPHLYCCSHFFLFSFVIVLLALWPCSN